jgi:hypothetical protein
MKLYETLQEQINTLVEVTLRTIIKLGFGFTSLRSLSHLAFRRSKAIAVA